MSVARILAEVVFLTSEEGGRQQPPVFATPAAYRPHLVVQDRRVRQPRTRDGNVIDENYLGVSFVDGPSEFRLGESVECTLRLDYPEAAYEELKTGAAFTVREGGRIVGHGIVLDQQAG